MGDRKKVRAGRWSRAGMLGGMAAGLAGDVVGAATKIGRKAVGDEFHRRAAERLLSSLGEMKGLPMKLGQMLSYVDDMVPPEYRHIYRDTLSTLRVRAVPLDASELDRIIEEDLGAPADEIFERFDRDPIAAASIGQVFRAVHEGRDVAVKVQYPGIREAIQSDLKNADTLISAFSVLLPRVELENTMNDVTSRLLEECDYANEMANQEAFAAAFAEDPNITVPQVLKEVSHTRVLVSAFDGRGWDEMLGSFTREEKSRAAEIIFRYVFESLYCHGMFNADPHPGNYLFCPDGRIAFLDYGCVQRFDDETLAAFVDVRDSVMRGVRGEPLRNTLSAAYGVPDGLDDEVWDLIEDYVILSFEPLIAPQPFKYDRAFTERVTRMTMEAKLKLAKKLFTLGIREATRPGLVFMNRINFGLNSILAALEAEADWPALLAEIEA